jgi:hypothetical protein
MLTTVPASGGMSLNVILYVVVWLIWVSMTIPEKLPVLSVAV